MKLKLLHSVNYKEFKTSNFTYERVRRTNYGRIVSWSYYDESELEWIEMFNSNEILVLESYYNEHIRKNKNGSELY